VVSNIQLSIENKTQHM